MSLGGDSAPFGDSLKLAEVWQGDSVTWSSAQRAGGEGLPFPTHPGTAAVVRESDPLQDVAVIFHDHSWQWKGSVQAQDEVIPSSSPSGSPIIAAHPADGSGLGWHPPALQLCYLITHPT